MEDLQTDVMRFMAILAFCLVAVFALVQSMPMRPEPPVPQKEVQRQRLTPTPRATPPEPPRPAAQTPTPPKGTTAPPAPPRPRATERTFTLRFASDAALHRLVSMGKVQLYALGNGNAWRLSPQADRLVFEPAPAPDRMHLMSENTVPSSLVLALGRTAPSRDDVTWGVTLPGATSEAITRHLRSPAGGVLVIQADGDVRRESPGELGKGDEP